MTTTISGSLRPLLTPLVRAFVRYTPLVLDKRSFWDRIVNPYFAWNSHKFVASTVFGSKIAGNTREILQQYVYYFGVWEPNLTRWIATRLRPGDTFIDVGANIGYFSLLASKIVGDAGKVVSIEASPKIFEALIANLTRNRVRNVRPVNIAVSDGPGIVKVFGGNDYHTGLTTICEQRGLKFECEVQTATLGTILQPEELRTARLIKIDVEGAEWRAVQGMLKVLSITRSDLEIMVEINPELLLRQGKDPEDLLRMFSSAGFNAYSLENDYTALSYLTPHNEKRPLRFRTPINCETDMIFSRQDARQL